MTVDSPMKARVLNARVYAGGSVLDFDHDIYLNSVELSPSREPNRASLTVYNLGERNRGILSADHQAIEIVGGYKPFDGLVFRGETFTVQHVAPKQNEPSWVTVIEAQDSGQTFADSWVSSTWPSGTPVNAVVVELGQSMGLPTKAELTGALNDPWCYNGRTADALSEFCEDRGLVWDIYQGILEVIPDGNSVARTTALAVKVSADSGMVGAPALVERKPKGGRKRFGVAVKMQMDARIRPHGLVKIESWAPTAGLARTRKSTYKTPGVNGVYRVGRVTHYGSMHTQDFYTEFETESFFANG